MLLQSTITCPHCGHAEAQTMAEDSCRVVYDCPGCGEKLTPKKGHCCVFCSYGDIPCPPVQREGACCAQPPVDAAPK